MTTLETLVHTAVEIAEMKLKNAGKDYIITTEKKVQQENDSYVVRVFVGDDIASMTVAKGYDDMDCFYHKINKICGLLWSAEIQRDVPSEAPAPSVAR